MLKRCFLNLNIINFLTGLCVISQADGVSERQPISGSKGQCRPEFRLHVQTADHWEQQRRKDLFPLPLRRQLVHVGIRQHRRHRLQGQDRLSAR